MAIYLLSRLAALFLAVALYQFLRRKDTNQPYATGQKYLQDIGAAETTKLHVSNKPAIHRAEIYAAASHSN